MTSLRTRLLLVTVLVAAVAVLVSALFSRQVVNSEFRRFIGARPVDLAPVMRDLETLVRTQGSLAGSEPVLARFAPRLGHALLLADSSGAAIASSAPVLRAARVSFGDSGRVTIAGVGVDGVTRTGLLLELHRPPASVVHDAVGRAIATLFVLPEARGPDVASGTFLRGVTRGLWQGALAAILVGAALVWLLSARILGPIEALTRAARRLERGDLSARVVVGGRDEVAKLARHFNAMASSLGRSSDLRKQLTHDVAHELRTPLTNLRAQVEALQDGLLEPNAASLASLHEEILLLASLVADLEQLAEAEAGVLRLDLADVPVAEALRTAVAAFAPSATAHGVTVDVAAPPELAARADDRRLAQILRNLIANAITHTPAGGRVSLSAVRDGERVAVTVADTGAGIAREHLPHVFDRFWRADASRTRATGGAGLGLAIVQQLVLAHGGDVRAESEPGRGTRITFRLPAA
jgi:signal transduction histidine kinase